MGKQYTLRNELLKDEAFHLTYYGHLDYFYLEGVAHTIQDYHSCKGSLEEFTKDDFEIAEEYGFNKAELKWLCEDEED